MEIDAEKYDGSIESVEKIRKLLQKRITSSKVEAGELLLIEDGTIRKLALGDYVILSLNGFSFRYSGDFERTYTAKDS